MNGLGTLKMLLQTRMLSFNHALKEKNLCDIVGIRFGAVQSIWTIC